jgi:hypothetical protein
MKFTIFLRLALIAFCLSSCVPGDGSRTASDPAGFFWGVWHGWIAPISLVWGFFKPAVRIYEYYNTGWWYDFGYYMAIISGFGGLSIIRRNRH